MRLNQTNRNEIVQRALEKGFDERQKVLKGVEHGLADKIYRERYSETVIAEVNKIEREWFNLTSYMSVNLNGWTLHFAFEGDERPYCTGKPRVISEELAKEVNRYLLEHEIYEKERDATGKALRAILNKCQSVKQLQKLWPEGAEFYADLAPTEVNLPAVDMSMINTRLGLGPVSVGP